MRSGFLSIVTVRPIASSIVANVAEELALDEEEDEAPCGAPPQPAKTSSMQPIRKPRMMRFMKLRLLKLSLCA